MITADCGMPTTFITGPRSGVSATVPPAGFGCRLTAPPHGAAHRPIPPGDTSGARDRSVPGAASGNTDYGVVTSTYVGSSEPA